LFERSPISTATMPQEIMIRANPSAARSISTMNATGNLQQKISKEEDTGAKTDHIIRELRFAVLISRRRADVHPIEVSNDVEEKQVGPRGAA